MGRRRATAGFSASRSRRSSARRKGRSPLAIGRAGELERDAEGRLDREQVANEPVPDVDPPGRQLDRLFHEVEPEAFGLARAPILGRAGCRGPRPGHPTRAPGGTARPTLLRGTTTVTGARGSSAWASDDLVPQRHEARLVRTARPGRQRHGGTVPSGCDADRSDPEAPRSAASTRGQTARAQRRCSVEPDARRGRRPRPTARSRPARARRTLASGSAGVDRVVGPRLTRPGCAAPRTGARSRRRPARGPRRRRRTSARTR